MFYKLTNTPNHYISKYLIIRIVFAGYFVEKLLKKTGIYT